MRQLAGHATAGGGVRLGEVEALELLRADTDVAAEIPAAESPRPAPAPSGAPASSDGRSAAFADVKAAAIAAPAKRANLRLRMTASFTIGRTDGTAIRNDEADAASETLSGA